MKHTMPKNVNVRFMAYCADCDIAEIVTTESDMTDGRGFSMDSWEITCAHLDACSRMKLRLHGRQTDEVRKL